MTGVAAVEACQVPVANEERLNLPLLESADTATEERITWRPTLPLQVAPQEPRRGAEQRLLGPCPTLEALDHDPAAIHVDIFPAKECHLSHPQAVVIDQREESAVAEVPDDEEERSKFE